MRRFARENGLSLFFGALFLCALAAQSVAGQHAFNAEQTEHGGAALSWWSYVRTELLIVVLVMSVLAGSALLRLIELRNTARAAEIAGDFRVITVAAYNYHADNNAWPPEAGPGVIPPALGAYLPGSFRFTRPTYTLDYDNLGVGGAYVVGVTVTSADAKLMTKLVQNLGSKHPYFSAGGALTDLSGRAIFPFDLAHYEGAKVPCLAAAPKAYSRLMEEIRGNP